MLLVLAWGFWLPYWVPAFLVGSLVAWIILHHRLEAGLGEALRRRWRGAWPPGPLVLIPLLVASALAFVLADAPTTAKVVPIGLDVLALSVVLFGHWWSRIALPWWLGGPSRSRVRASVAIGTDALTTQRGRP